MLASGAKAIILRTAWVYAATGKNFVRTMLTVGKTRDRLTVVADQHGCPTAAADLADAILAIVARIDATGWQPAYQGIFHAAGTGATTWFGLAVATFEEAAPPWRERARGRRRSPQPTGRRRRSAPPIRGWIVPAARRLRRPPAALAGQPDPDGRRRSSPPRRLNGARSDRHCSRDSEGTAMRCRASLRSCCS